MSNLNVILFECPRCLKNLRVDKEEAGNRIDCPKCKQTLTVPSQSADAGLFDDLFDSAPASRPVSESAAKGTASRTRKPQDSDSGLALVDEPSSKSGDAEAELGVGSENSVTDLFGEQADDDPIAGLVIPEPKAIEQNPDVGKDPFEVDHDAPLKVDGIGDLFSSDEAFGTKCSVCDTRVHVTKKQIGSEVECPVCYSKVKIKPPQTNSTMTWEKKTGVKKPSNSDKKKSHIAADDELKLSDPVDLPKVEIDPSWGLAPVEEDMLAPKIQSPDDPDSDASDLEVGTAVRPKKRRAPSGQATPGKPKAASSKRTKSGSKSRRAKSAQPSFDSGAAKDFPDFEMPELLTSAVEMVKDPGVLTRAAVAFGLMCLGAILMQWISPAYEVIAEDAEVTMAAGLFKAAKWSVAFLIYLAGLAVLWWTSSYLFRDAALGKRTVASWSFAGTNEILSTVLVFVFGFFIGGLPMAFVGALILPLRFLMGPLFLLSAWYNQSPFAIVSVDAFQNANEDATQWMNFYIFAAGLAFLGFVAGIVFWMRVFLPFILGIPATVFGVAICVATTLLFAVVCGWHCGRVVESLETSR